MKGWLTTDRRCVLKVRYSFFFILHQLQPCSTLRADKGWAGGGSIGCIIEQLPRCAAYCLGYFFYRGCSHVVLLTQQARHWHAVYPQPVSKLSLGYTILFQYFFVSHIVYLLRYGCKGNTFLLFVTHIGWIINKPLTYISYQILLVN